MKKCCSRLEGLIEPKLFKALGDPSRAAMLARLATACEGISVSEMAKAFSIDVSVASRHLALLREAGVARGTRKGKEVTYLADHGALSRTLRKIADAIDACCPEGKGTGGG